MPTILLVDDEQLLLVTMAAQLRSAGYNVVEASSADEARAAVNSEQLDLAVLDINMPGEDGIKLGSWLSENTLLPFIYLTGYSDDQLVQQGVKVGAYSYLVKPVEISQLAPVIEAALKRSRDTLALEESEEKLLKALHNNRTVSVAVGILMERYKLSNEEAFGHIRTRARSEQIKVDKLATDIVASAELLNSLK